jgi:hypothetical protein
MITTDTTNKLGITVAKDLRTVMQGKVAIAGEASYEGAPVEALDYDRGPFLNRSIWARQSPMKFPASEAGGLHHKWKTELNRFLHECTNTTLYDS